MTQITTAEELIEVLNADPELRQRLFEAFGLSALPELFRRMDTFEETQQRILETLAQHGETLQTHGQLLQTQGEMLRRHGEILVEHSEMLRALREDVDSLGDTSNRLVVKLDNLNSMVRGEQVERKALNVVFSRLVEVAGKRIRRIEPMLSQSGAVHPNTDYTWPIQDAAAKGEISDSDYDRLMMTDIVFRAYSRHTLQLFPVEVSNTIDKDDVDRAARSADILKTIFDDAETTPIVAGTFIDGWLRDHADKVGVKVVTFIFDED